MFGNLVFLAGFVIILQYVAHDFIPLNKLAWVEKPSAWARGFSTAVFAFEGKFIPRFNVFLFIQRFFFLLLQFSILSTLLFELYLVSFLVVGICLVLPLRNKMRKQEDYMGCNGVLMTSMYLVLILYLCLGKLWWNGECIWIWNDNTNIFPQEILQLCGRLLFNMLSFVCRLFLVKLRFELEGWSKKYFDPITPATLFPYLNHP